MGATLHLLLSQDIKHYEGVLWNEDQIRRRPLEYCHEKALRLGLKVLLKMMHGRLDTKQLETSGSGWVRASLGQGRTPRQGGCIMANALILKPAG